MSESLELIKKKVPLVAILAVTAFGFLVRFPELDRESLWGDEINLTRAALKPTVGETVDSVEKPHSVGYPIFLHFWMKGGQGEAYVRLPSLVCGVLSIYLLFSLLEPIIGWRVALTAAFFLALMPAHIRFSRETAAYSAQTAVLIGAVIFWFHLIRENRWIQWTGFVLLAALSHYLHPLASTTSIGLFFLLPVVWKFGVSMRSSDYRIAPRPAAWGRWIVCGVVYWLLVHSQIRRNIEGAAENVGTAATAPGLADYLQELGRLLAGMGWLLGPLVMIGILVLFLDSWLIGLVFTGWAAGTTAVWLAFVRSQSAHFDFHYFLSHLPAVVVLSALGMEGILLLIEWVLSKKMSRTTYLVGSVWLFFLGGIGFAYRPEIIKEQQRKWPDYRRAGQFLTYRLEPDDRFYIKPEGWLPMKIRYYCRSVQDQEVGLEVFFKTEIQEQLERKGGTLYVVTRRPFPETGGYRNRRFHGVTINWKENPSEEPVDYRELYQHMRRSAGKRRPLDLLHEAIQLQKIRLLDAASATIIQAASDAPYDPRILRRKAEILAEAGRYAEAAAAFEAAWERIRPKEKWFMRVEQATCLGKLGNHREAIEILKKAFDHPNCNVAKVWEDIGRELIDLKEYPSARKALQKSLEVWKGDRPLALKYLGDIASIEGNTRQALEYYRRALKSARSENRQAIEKRIRDLETEASSRTEKPREPLHTR